MDQFKCLPLTMLDSVIRVNKKYYPQTHSGECKYEIKRNRIENIINDDLDHLMNLIMNLIMNLMMNLGVIIC